LKQGVLSEVERQMRYGQIDTSGGQNQGLEMKVGRHIKRYEIQGNVQGLHGGTCTVKGESRVRKRLRDWEEEKNTSLPKRTELKKPLQTDQKRRKCLGGKRQRNVGADGKSDEAGSWAGGFGSHPYVRIQGVRDAIKTPNKKGELGTHHLTNRPGVHVPIKQNKNRITVSSRGRGSAAHLYFGKSKARE